MRDRELNRSGCDILTALIFRLVEVEWFELAIGDIGSFKSELGEAVGTFDCAGEAVGAFDCAGVKSIVAAEMG